MAADIQDKVLTSPVDIDYGIRRFKEALPLAKEVIMMGWSSERWLVRWRKCDKEPYSRVHFAFPQHSIFHYISVMSKAAAASAISMESLELSCHCPDGAYEHEFFAEALKSFGEAGHWKDCLKTMYLTGWNCVKGSSVSSLGLRTLPSTLRTLEFWYRSNDADVRACTAMVNSLAQQLPMLETLRIVFAYAESEECILNAALDALDSTCPRLSEIRIREGINSDGILMPDTEVKKISESLAHFSSLKQFCYSGRCLQQNAVDDILHATLSQPHIEQLSLHNRKPGPAGINTILSYLSKNPDEVTLRCLSMKLSRLSSDEIRQLSKAKKRWLLNSLRTRTQTRMWCLNGE